MQTILTVPNKETSKKRPKQISSTDSKEAIEGKMIKK